MDEELLSRQPPQSLEAEQAVLGSILIDSRCITDVVGLVKPEHFYLQQNREIYETIYTMFNFSQTIDPVTVLDKLKELGYHHDNSRDYILQLMEITPTAANVVRYANIVRDKSMLRGLNQAATDIQEMVSEEVGTPAEMLESAEKKIYALRKGEREIPKFIDAFFEIVSGFTTTGASILPEVESLSWGILYWRSFSHWLGGMGVLVFLLAFAPSGGKGQGFTMHLLRAESPGPNVGKLVPKMRKTAVILYQIGRNCHERRVSRLL